MDKNFWPPILALAIPLLALLIPIAYIVFRFVLQSRKAQLMHETLRHFAQLGQPIPPELLQQEPPSAALISTRWASRKSTPTSRTRATSC